MRRRKFARRRTIRCNNARSHYSHSSTSTFAARLVTEIIVFDGWLTTFLRTFLKIGWRPRPTREQAPERALAVRKYCCAT